MVISSTEHWISSARPMGHSGGACGMAVGRISRWAKCQCGWRLAAGAHGSESLGRTTRSRPTQSVGEPSGPLDYHGRGRQVACRLAQQQCSVVSWTVVLVDGQTGGGYFSAGGVASVGTRKRRGSFGIGNTTILDIGLFCFTRLWGDMR